MHKLFCSIDVGGDKSSNDCYSNIFNSRVSALVKK